MTHNASNNIYISEILLSSRDDSLTVHMLVDGGYTTGAKYREENS
jgi:hypothetical protein